MYIINLLPRSLEGHYIYSNNMDANRYLMKRHSQDVGLICGISGAYSGASTVRLAPYELIKLNIKEVLQ